VGLGPRPRILACRAIILDGDPGSTAIWNRVGEILGRTWEHATGARMASQRLAVDTGFATQMVYQWTRGQDRTMVLPVRGVGAYDRLRADQGRDHGERPQIGARAQSVDGLGQLFQKGILQASRLVKADQ
jgi:phage terminase large subunit GpA-like protein